MSNKDRQGREKRKQHNPLDGDTTEMKRVERREKKQALKVIRRRSKRTGHVQSLDNSSGS
jgi:hypothetical protein